MDYDEDKSPTPGTGEVDYDVKLLFGRSLYPLPAYASADVGYCFRGGDAYQSSMGAVELYTVRNPRRGRPFYLS